MNIKQLFIAVVVVAAGTNFGSNQASYGLAPAPIYFDGIMGPAIVKAQQVLRENPPADATDAQVQQLDEQKAAALDRLKGALLGRNVLAVFTVTNVIADKNSGGFDVEGVINWHEPAARDRAVREAIATVNKHYESAIVQISKTDYTNEYNNPRKRRNQDIHNANRQRRSLLEAITEAITPPPQRILVHTVDPAVLTWRTGQIRTVFGSVTSVNDGVTMGGSSYGERMSIHDAKNVALGNGRWLGVWNHTYVFLRAGGIANAGDLFDSYGLAAPFSGTVSSYDARRHGGDYVTCVIGMHWIADHAPQATGQPVALKTSSSPAKFRIVLKNGSTVRVTSCTKHGNNYRVTEFGMQIDIPVASVVSVTKLSVPPGK